MQVLNLFKTGDSNLDNFILVVGTSVLSWVTDYLTDFRAKEIFNWKRLFYTEHLLNINSFTDDGYFQNIYYKSILWYINKINLEQGQFNAEISGIKKSQTSLITLYDGHTVTIKYHGLNITITKYTVKTIDKTESRYIQLKTFDKTIKNLKNFLFEINDMYSAYQKETEWEPSVYTLSKDLHFGRYSLDNIKTFDSIVLNPDEKQNLINDLDIFMASEEKYKKLGIAWKRGYLLHGPPGCGKSSLVQAISFRTKMSIYIMNLNDYQTDRDFINAYSQIPSNSIILFEDIDAQTDIVKSRSEIEESAKDSKKSDPFSECIRSTLSLSAVLNEIDGIKGCHRKIIIMNTNHPEKLDPALIRPGRMDYHYSLTRCSRQVIGLFFERFYNKKISDSDLLKIEEFKHAPSFVSNLMLSTNNPDDVIEILSK